MGTNIANEKGCDFSIGKYSANIVEGAVRNHGKEYVQFLYIAMGSLAELGYYIVRTDWIL